MKVNLLKIKGSVLLNIFLDRSQNYESNRTNFIIFGALSKEI
jgi:hypothetical protein